MRLTIKPIQVVFLVSLTFYNVEAQAYLDPATGSMLLSAIVGIVFTVFYLIKGMYYKIMRFIYSVLHIKVKDKKKLEIVLYSEGAQYWNTFRPIVEELTNRAVPVTYLTSDQNDDGLSYRSQYFISKYIGKGNKAYARLNALEATLCVMTTPGLDVLQIRRSKGVDHYSHLVHAPTTGTYKLYSFDYFDSVLCSGQHQIDAIRDLENKRGTTPKILLQTGCAYMDVMAKKLSRKKYETPSHRTSEAITILLAPSWGANGLLQRFGSRIISILLDSGFKVIVRPHPQTHIIETKMLERIKSELGSDSNLEWDIAADGFDSLWRSDLMISDFSGVIFDYAFIFEKPVITIKLDIDLRGLDANHLSSDLWELGILNEIGKRINGDDIDKLSAYIKKLIEDTNSLKKLIDLRKKSLFNFGSVGSVATEQLLEIQKGVS